MKDEETQRSKVEIRESVEHHIQICWELEYKALLTMLSTRTFLTAQNGALHFPFRFPPRILHPSTFKTLSFSLSRHGKPSPFLTSFPKGFHFPPTTFSDTSWLQVGGAVGARSVYTKSNQGFLISEGKEQYHQSFSDMEDFGSCRAGEIHVILGPMFAGKTTALIRKMQSEADLGRKVVLVKSDKDTRYGLHAVISHDGAEMPCRAATDLASFKASLGEEYKKIDVIGIDESQFFKDLYSFCQDAADRDGKTVIVAGLDGDYLRKSFGSALDLIPLADSVVKLKSRCELCGKAAAFTLRKTGDRKTEVIGGADIYMPVCRQHYLNGQLVIDATRNVLESKTTQFESHFQEAAAISG